MIIDMIMEVGKYGTKAANNHEKLNKRWG